MPSDHHVFKSALGRRDGAIGRGFMICDDLTSQGANTGEHSYHLRPDGSVELLKRGSSRVEGGCATPEEISACECIDNRATCFSGQRGRDEERVDVPVRWPNIGASNHAHLHFFAFGRSSRISRNSFGPQISARFRRACSSGDIDLSLRGSISRAANFDALCAVSLFGGRLAGFPTRARSMIRRIASERVGRSSCFLHQSSNLDRRAEDKRIAVTGSRPVAGRPLFFGSTAIDFAIKR
jgi:hypothetical protein